MVGGNGRTGKQSGADITPGLQLGKAEVLGAFQELWTWTAGQKESGDWKWLTFYPPRSGAFLFRASVLEDCWETGLGEYEPFLVQWCHPERKLKTGPWTHRPPRGPLTAVVWLLVGLNDWELCQLENQLPVGPPTLGRSKGIGQTALDHLSSTLRGCDRAKHSWQTGGGREGEGGWGESVAETSTTKPKEPDYFQESISALQSQTLPSLLEEKNQTISIYQLCKVKHFLNSHARRLFFLSCISYCSTLSDSASENATKPLVRRYKHVIKAVLL